MVSHETELYIFLTVIFNVLVFHMLCAIECIQLTKMCAL